MKPLFGLDTPVKVNYLNTYNLAAKQNLKALQFSTSKYASIRDMIDMRNRPTGIPTIIHGNLGYNLAGSAQGTCDPQYNKKLTNTKAGLLTELDMSTIMNIPVIVHIGTQPDYDIGIKTIIDTLNQVIAMEGVSTMNYARLLGLPVTDFQHQRRVILENAAGRGNSIGMTLDEISIILSGISPTFQDSVGICIDTCHLSDAGQFTLRDVNSVNQFFEAFDQKIGRNKLKVMHLNDSKNPFGSRCDRHEHLGQGYIYQNDGISGLKELLKIAAEREIPLIGEFSDGGGMRDVELVNSLI